MRSLSRTIVRTIVGVIGPVLMLSHILSAGLPLNILQGPLEGQFAALGKHPVLTEELTVNGQTLRVSRPTDNAGALPAVIWGNGSDAGPDQYAGLLEHLASWGFVVVDNYDENTGTGASIIATLQAVTGANGDEGSPLFEQVDLEAIGLVGHSQGATGVINAHRNFPEGASVRTVVSVALPALEWCDPEDRYDTSAVTAPFLILGGLLDPVISPYSSNKEALQRLPESTPGLLAMTSAGHNEVQGDGGAYRGYLTAWLRAQLGDDAEARDAVIGPDAEIANNLGWHGVLRNG